jgi:hypothetical protein
MSNQSAQSVKSLPRRQAGAAKKITLLDLLLIIGSILFIAGLCLILNDSMNSSWCPSSSKKISFDLREYLNGPLLLIVGLAMGIYPAILQLKKWKKEK